MPDRPTRATNNDTSPAIGTLGEKSLHAAIKTWYARPGDLLEVSVDGYVIDIVRGDLLIEIQTQNFTSIRRKLASLLDEHPVRLVHPISRAKWIVRLPTDDRSMPKRRKSPKRGTVEDIFVELVRLPALVAHPHLSIEVLLVHEEEILVNDGQGSWRRKGWSIHDRRLLDVVDSAVFKSPSDFLTLLPDDLPGAFTNQDLAAALARPRYVAQKMTYCLRKMGVLDVIGKQGNAFLFSIAPQEVSRATNT